MPTPYKTPEAFAEAFAAELASTMRASYSSKDDHESIVGHRRRITFTHRDLVLSGKVRDVIAHTMFWLEEHADLTPFAIVGYATKPTAPKAAMSWQTTFCVVSNEAPVDTITLHPDLVDSGGFAFVGLPIERDPVTVPAVGEAIYEPYATAAFKASAEYDSIQRAVDYYQQRSDAYRAGSWS